MDKKYINIKQEITSRTLNQREALMELVPKDIIFVLSYPDTQYPSDSAMNMGQFCEVAYLQDGKIIWQTFNPEATSPIEDFMAQLGDRVEPILKGGAFGAYIGKPREEFNIDRQDLIYQGKYRFEGDRYMIGFDSIFGNTEDN